MKPSDWIIKRAFEITNGPNATGGRPASWPQFIQAIAEYLDEAQPKDPGEGK